MIFFQIVLFLLDWIDTNNCQKQINTAAKGLMIQFR